MLSDISFAYPWVLFFLLAIPVMGVWYWKFGRKRSASVTYSSLDVLKNYKLSLKERFYFLPVILRLLALALFIIALARPQSFSSGENIYAEGIDIALVLDVSGSMLAEDFKPNRLDASKKVINDFIGKRTSDRIGLVIFAGESFTQCPLTVDYSVLTGLVKEIKSGNLEDGTAIGNAVANGVNRLKESKAKSKVIILVTDGVNNSGEVDPVTSAEIAKTFGIKIYAIGVGTKGEAPYPIHTPFGVRYQMMPVEIDEAVLKDMAKITDGKYYRALNNNKLQDIYDEIDRLEKTKVEITSYRNATEHFYGWLGGGLILLFLELGLARTIFRKIP